MILLCILTVINPSPCLLASSIAIPEPKVMLERADVVARGDLKTEGGVVYFVPSEVLKGEIKMKGKYRVEEIRLVELLPPSYFVMIAKDTSVIFVGNFDTKKSTVNPIFGVASIWPLGVSDPKSRQAR